MGLSCRNFLLDQNDTLYRLPNSKFARMLHDPDCYTLPRFAGGRVRMSEVVVELLDRRAIRIVRITCSVLTFDARGRIDIGAYERHQFARAESAMASVLVQPATTGVIVDATTHFTAQGGRWAPSEILAHRIEQAALGRVKCPGL